MIRLDLRAVALAAAMLMISAPASAQATSGTCPAPSAIEQNDQITIGRTWLPMRIGIDLAKASCRAHDFLANFFKRQPDPDKATLDDVMEASKPDAGESTDRTYQTQRSRMPSPTSNPGWNRTPTTSIVVLPPAPGSETPILYQPNNSTDPIPTNVAQIQGRGTLLSSEGMKRGTFQNGRLNGVGEEIDPNGTWRAGTYDRGTNTGQVFEVKKLGGRTYLTAGSIVNGKRDGMVERIFADGSTQFEDWEDGKLMQVGVRAPKGQSAIAPQARYKPREEVATEDAYQHTGPRTRIAPGTTFDPGRATRPLTYDKSRTPTIDQSVSVCGDDWKYLKYWAGEIPGINLVFAARNAETQELLAESADSNLCARFSSKYNLKPCTPEVISGSKCYIKAVLDGRSGHFRTNSMIIEGSIEGDTRGRQDY